MAPMPYHQETDGQSLAYDPLTVAPRATAYYGELFMGPGEDDMEARELIACRSQGWHDDVVITQEDVRTAIYSMARGKTTGADRIPAEAWHMAADLDDRICMTLAWAFNRRIFDIAPTPMDDPP